MKASYEAEINALKTILEILEPLDVSQRTFVLKTVMDRMQLVSPASTTQPKRENGTVAANTNDNESVTPKIFLRQKQPANGVEQLTCLAYYLTHQRAQPYFKTNELTELNHEAGGQRLSNPSVFARNAVSQNGFFAPAGGGRKRLTTLGELVVEALPDREKAREAIASSKKRHAKKKSRSSLKKESV